MALLPPDLRGFDGHPLAGLAAQVREDLIKVGIPVHVLDDSGRNDHAVNGVTLNLAEGLGYVSLAWHIPDERHYHGQETVERDRVYNAAVVLTSAVTSVLTTFGHRVSVEFTDPEYVWPFICVTPDNAA
ncbi:hypothetical protein [Streptomyces sp. NPDC050704]|uniref:hypothetical protein n=1 Tax=Streptomyces sp. NPDC050704 TaxID=3157219 RepID=UPI0034194EF5